MTRTPLFFLTYLIGDFRDPSSTGGGCSSPAPLGRDSLVPTNAAAFLPSLSATPFPSRSVILMTLYVSSPSVLTLLLGRRARARAHPVHVYISFNSPSTSIAIRGCSILLMRFGIRSVDDGGLFPRARTPPASVRRALAGSWRWSVRLEVVAQQRETRDRELATA